MNNYIDALHHIRPVNTEATIQQKNNPIMRDFSTYLKNALENVSEIEKESNVKTELLANGKIDQLHDVMIAAQKASLAIETTVQIQQKVIDTYNEVMRMQL